MRRSSTIWLVMIWLVLGMPPASSTPKPPPQGAAASSGKKTDRPILVSHISVTPGAEGEVTINVATTKSARFHMFRLESPDRLVVDLEGARNRFHRKSIPVSSPVVRDVRVGQLKVDNREVVRVVADLSGDPLFDANAIAGGVRIEVKPRPRAASGVVAPTPERKVEAAGRSDEQKNMPLAAPATEAAGASHLETHKEPATNRVSQNSTPVPSPVAKDAREGKSQDGNPEAVPVVDDVLRFLFGQGAPSPGTAASPARREEPLPVNRLEGPSLVSDISVRPGSAGEITIDVAVTKASPFQALRIGNPDRLVVDIKGARNRFPRNSVPVASPLVKEVRVGQSRGKNAEAVRVVVDLSGHPVCDTHPYEGGLRIEVKPRPQAASQGLATAANGKTR
jgi:hypothetical protein